MNTNQSLIQPWLTVSDGEKAVAFYKAAFNAIETYRLDEPEAGVVVKLSIHGAEFWISDGADDTMKVLGGNSVRMILTSLNPEAVFEKAIAAGATEIFPVGEDHGWKLGRVEDPFGLHWEIGHLL